MRAANIRKMIYLFILFERSPGSAFFFSEFLGINENCANKMTICKRFNKITTKQNTFFTYINRHINVIYTLYIIHIHILHAHSQREMKRERKNDICNIQCHFISSRAAYISRLLRMERFSIKFMAFYCAYSPVRVAFSY